MIHQQAGLHIAVPAPSAPAFEDEILAVAGRVGGGQAVGDIGLQRPQSHFSKAGQGREFLHPAHHHPLLGGEIRGRPALVVVVAGAHDVVIVGGARLSVLRPVGVIEVGKAQGMGEFVGRRPDSAHSPVHIGVSGALRSARIDAEFHSVQRGGIGPCGGEGRFMGPDGIVLSLGLVPAGVVHEDHVHLAVPVVVVLAPVDFVVMGLDSRPENLGGILLLGVVSHGAVVRIGAEDIEIRLEKAHGIVQVIVADRSGGAVGGIPRLVQHVGEGLLRRLYGEGAVAELDQHDRIAGRPGACPPALPGVPAGADSCGLLVGGLPPSQRLPVRAGGGPVKAVPVPGNDGLPVSHRGPMQEFVPVADQRNR